MILTFDKNPPTTVEIKEARRKLYFNSLLKFFTFCFVMGGTILTALYVDYTFIKFTLTIFAVLFALVGIHIVHELMIEKLSWLPYVELEGYKYHSWMDLTEEYLLSEDEVIYFLEKCPELKSYIKQVEQMQRNYYTFEILTMRYYVRNKTSDVKKERISELLNSES
ncbi:hypothetical protein OKZ62_001846 [Vibrio navarrensis]|nr:hypothetical protein [Vibrio navarrensis]